MGLLDLHKDTVGIDVTSLGLIERVLLACDGTLTDTVEAVFLESIQLVKLNVTSYLAPAPVEDLAVKKGSPVMRRAVLLQGVNTKTNYVYAQTLIALDALPEQFRVELESSDNPIGRLWVQHKLETRKELVKIWRVPASDVSLYFGEAGQTGLLARSYRVFNSEKPIMLITEYFPATSTPR